MVVAIFPGSFDPVTNGHLDIIKRASLIFDEVVVLILKNLSKKSMFLVEERKRMIELVTENLNNVKVDTYEGLLAEYINSYERVARNINKTVIVKGVRSTADFEYEFEMALINKKINCGVETILFPADKDNIIISSSNLKQILSFGGDVSWIVPPEIEETVKQKFSEF